MWSAVREMIRRKSSTHHIRRRSTHLPTAMAVLVQAVTVIIVNSALKQRSRRPEGFRTALARPNLLF